mmetsp:Transcript_61789/g.180575  ORF Transcript_61789/g.180575 Transcript_61789/m.180575 type:complete len:230 (-) Transcript_61789:164-853(-)
MAAGAADRVPHQRHCLRLPGRDVHLHLCPSGQHHLQRVRARGAALLQAHVLGLPRGGALPHLLHEPGAAQEAPEPRGQGDLAGDHCRHPHGQHLLHEGRHRPDPDHRLHGQLRGLAPADALRPRRLRVRGRDRGPPLHAEGPGRVQGGLHGHDFRGRAHHRRLPVWLHRHGGDGGGTLVALLHVLAERAVHHRRHDDHQQAFCRCADQGRSAWRRAEVPHSAILCRRGR